MGRRGSIALLVVLIAAVGLAVWGGTRPGPKTWKSFCTAWKPGASDLMRQYPPTTEATDPDTTPQPGPARIQPLDLIPGPDAKAPAEQQVDALLARLEKAAPGDAKGATKRYIKARQSLRTMLTERSSGTVPATPTALNALTLATDNGGQTDLNADLMAYCGMPPY